MRYPAGITSLLLLLVLGVTACSRSASREDAEQWLPSAGKWKLREVTVTTAYDPPNLTRVRLRFER